MSFNTAADKATDRALRNMTYHQPTEDTQELLVLSRREFKSHTTRTRAFPMDPRCRALMLTALEEALMWASKGIVLQAEKDSRDAAQGEAAGDHIAKTSEPLDRPRPDMETLRKQFEREDS